MKQFILLLILAIVLFACSSKSHNDSGGKDYKSASVLKSWNNDSKYDTDTTISINTIIKYVEAITDPNSKSFIPVEDRIAVFDMDGTIACERPFSLELYCSSQLAFGTTPKCNANGDSLQNAIKKKFGSYLPGNIASDSLIALFTTYSATLVNSCIPVNMPSSRILCNQFYKPMIELIKYLKLNEFEVYIVSGSSQQFLWAILKNVKPLSKLCPSHIIGSLQKYKKIIHPDGRGPRFYLDTANFLSNVSQGKAINIYNRIGKQPVFAFGNTVDDFDMFSITSSNNKYSTMCVLLNHDSKDIEDAYLPYKPQKEVVKNWNQPEYKSNNWSNAIFSNIMRSEGWKIANMSQCFNRDSVFIGN